MRCSEKDGFISGIKRKTVSFEVFMEGRVYLKCSEKDRFIWGVQRKVVSFEVFQGGTGI